MGATFLIIILLYHTLDDNTYCNVQISNYRRSEHQIKYLSSFVTFKCFGLSVFTLAASQSAVKVAILDFLKPNFRNLAFFEGR